MAEAQDMCVLSSFQSSLADLVIVARQAMPSRKETSSRVKELEDCIITLVKGDPGIQILQKLAILCLENPITEHLSPPPSPSLGLPISPSPFIAPSRTLPSLQSDIWDAGKNFERLFNSLIKFLEPGKASC